MPIYFDTNESQKVFAVFETFFNGPEIRKMHDRHEKRGILF